MYTRSRWNAKMEILANVFACREALRARNLQRVMRIGNDAGSKLLPKVQTGNSVFGCRPSCCA
jgi:hypothetical protein